MRYFILLALIVLVPILTGLPLTAWQKSEKSFARLFINGWISIFACFELLSLPMIYFHFSLTSFVRAAEIALAVLILLGIITERKNLFSYITGTLKNLKGLNIYWLLAGAIMLLQMFFYFFKMNPNDDDAFYLATASTSLATDTMYQYNPYTGDLYTEIDSRYILSPFPLFYSFLSKISGVHVAIIAHTFIPLVFVLAAYVVLFLIARELFKDDAKKQGMFVFFIALIYEFGSVTVRTTGNVLSVRIWQGKAVLAAILIPAIIEFLISHAKEVKMREFIYLFVLMISCAYVSSMGILMGPLALGIGMLTYLFVNKKLDAWIPAVIAVVPNLILAVIYVYIK
ncbi:MAG: hypothetical protein K6F37_01270 [Lachnospiraceae bacterium]|nr:hypothetical protein [Lachnospiraceae bacterium]